MALIPMEHTERLASPAQAEAFFRALGERRVSARGFHTREAAKIERIVDAVEPKREHTISFEAGTLARAPLDALAVAKFRYLDVEAANANLRIWPWLHSRVYARDGADAIATVLGIALVPGANHVGDTRVTLNPPDHGYPIDCETTTIATALRIFHAVARDPIKRGHIWMMRADTKPLLERFLVAIAARVDAVLELHASRARSLTELFAGDTLDWQAGGIIVDFPDGRIHGYLKSHEVSDRKRASWQRRVEKALKRARR